MASTAEVVATGSPEAEAGVIARDPAMRELYAFARQVASSDVGVLILGETGVGKELLARAIHEHSSRREQHMITLNCAAIPENLVESELFGYERGAFSGAVATKPGLFEAAHHSTLFLDEVGELPRTVQAKLLRVLETGDVQRLGSLRTNQVDVRIVAATNRDIQLEIERGTFRADLYYRLNGMTLTIPPLRERPDDIVALAEYFGARAARGITPQFSEEALASLCTYGWPGNVRELRSVIERAVLLSNGELIDAAQLVFDTAARATGSGERSLGEPPGAEISGTRLLPLAFTAPELPTGAVAAAFEAELARREVRRIRDALERAGGNQKDAAALLGMSRRTLINRLERYGIARPRKRRTDTDAS